MAEKDLISQLLLMQQLQAMEEANRRKQQQAMGQQQQQGGGGMSPMQGYNIYSNYISPSMGGGTAGGGSGAASSVSSSVPSGGSSAGSSAGIGTAGAYILAALAAGKGADLLTGDREQNGVHTGTIFEGKGFNDPFMTLTSQKMGWDDATPGEQLDADAKREDWSGLKKSIPEYAGYLTQMHEWPTMQLIEEAGFLPKPVQKGMKWMFAPVNSLLRLLS
jgi:hypothetical protein